MSETGSSEVSQTTKLGALETRTSAVWRGAGGAAVVSVASLLAGGMLGYAALEAVPIAEITSIHIPSAAREIGQIVHTNELLGASEALVATLLRMLTSPFLTTMVVVATGIIFMRALLSDNPGSALLVVIIAVPFLLGPALLEAQFGETEVGDPSRSSSLSLEASDWERSYVSAQNWYQAGSQKKVREALEKMAAEQSPGKSDPAVLHLLETAAFGAPQTPAAVAYLERTSAAAAVRRYGSAWLLGLGAFAGVLATGLAVIGSKMRRRVSLLSPPIVTEP